MLLMSRRDLEQTLVIDEVIGVIERGFADYKAGHYKAPVRMPVSIDNEEGLFLFMPAYSGTGSCFGTKMISVFPKNTRLGLPTLHAVYVLNDPSNGQFLALMDGVYLTAVRTGAASAVATKYLSRENSTVLGIIGAGAQAAFQAEAILAVRRIQKILVYDNNFASSNTFAGRVSDRLGIRAIATNTPREVVVESEILVTVTTSKVPVFDGHDLKPGTHINAVGAYMRDMQEVDTETIRKALVVVDTYEGCMAEAGDLLVPMNDGVFSRDDIHADLGEIITGKKRGRSTAEEITLFESVGFAVEDLVTAHLA